MLKKLINDDRGEASVTALVLIAAIVCLAAIVGLATLRDMVIQQFGDVGVAINNLDQSFSYEILIDTDGDGMLEDLGINGEYIDDAPSLVDNPGAAPACLNFTTAPGTENDPF
ncbi:hypothetical protein [Lignipirellula cremea]|uniref:Uncharacterized protein n=1 Tax=Lignipirellula cremea TaxID=2528010 RepID=A0A518E554_9BACT|nr:hypothetical protein [Lignipirellula cremea]QDU99211.1 hypothetical protein Pla8534_71240 [Lignipirellula cremea]